MEISRSDTALGRTYAQPLSGLRVSWGSILAGAVTVLAVSLILWALALAVTLTATNATLTSLKGSIGALLICAIATTLIGAFVGGVVAGYLPGNPHRIVSVGHSFLAWCVAFLIASAVEWGMVGRAIQTTSNALMQTTNTALATTGAAVGGGGARLDQKALNLLMSLGYTPTEARQMVESAQRDVQGTLKGPSNPTQAKNEARGALNTALDWGAGLGWAWFGTWFVSGILAVLGGALVSRRLQRDRDEVLGSSAPAA